MRAARASRPPGSDDAARFEAQLGSNRVGGATVYVTGHVCGYDIERIREAASYGVDHVKVTVYGSDTSFARKHLQGSLDRLARRGVDVKVVRA